VFGTSKTRPEPVEPGLLLLDLTHLLCQEGRSASRTSVQDVDSMVLRCAPI
jgi:hypothetical protein